MKISHCRPPFHGEEWAVNALSASITRFEAELFTSVKSPLVDLLCGDIEALGELKHLGPVPLLEWVKGGLQNSMFIFRHPMAKFKLRLLYRSRIFNFCDLEDRLDFCGACDRFCSTSRDIVFN